jgi:hypothetical protein
VPNKFISILVIAMQVIFIDFVKHAAFEVPVGFPRLGVVTTEHIKWVVSHPFTSLMVMTCALTSLSNL